MCFYVIPFVLGFLTLEIFEKNDWEKMKTKLNFFFERIVDSWGEIELLRFFRGNEKSVCSFVDWVKLIYLSCTNQIVYLYLFYIN